jgi:four helix bundle protein
MDERFKGLIVWQKSYQFALEVYKITKVFPKNELYGLVSQIRRAAISVSANIAEGYERNYRKEYIQFLMIAKGSLGEAETYLLFSKDLGYINKEEFVFLEEKRVEATKLLRGLINSLSSRPAS